MTGRAAIGILYDVTFTITPVGLDDGNPTMTGRTAGTPVTFKADKVSLSDKFSLSDHGTAQDEAEFNRIGKKPQTLTIETKLEKKASAPLLAALTHATKGEIFQFLATALGCSINDGAGSPGAVMAIREDLDVDYAGPSTLKITLRQYGTRWAISPA